MILILFDLATLAARVVQFFQSGIRVVILCASVVATWSCCCCWKQRETNHWLPQQNHPPPFLRDAFEKMLVIFPSSLSPLPSPFKARRYPIPGKRARQRVADNKLTRATQRYLSIARSLSLSLFLSLSFSLSLSRINSTSEFLWQVSETS
jgi:hypothetical protein